MESSLQPSNNGEDHNRSRIEEFRPAVFANAEDVEADLIGKLNLLK